MGTIITVECAVGVAQMEVGKQKHWTLLKAAAKVPSSVQGCGVVAHGGLRDVLARLEIEKQCRVFLFDVRNYVLTITKLCFLNYQDFSKSLDSVTKQWKISNEIVATYKFYMPFPNTI